MLFPAAALNPIKGFESNSIFIGTSLERMSKINPRGKESSRSFKGEYVQPP